MTAPVDATEQKRLRARAFLSRLGTRDLCFTGVSGSSSYAAEHQDDIDIFLITRTHRLWRSLARALLLRRLHRDRDICISLTMDAAHARRIFEGEGDFLLASDSLHVLPVHGAAFYEHLLAGAPFVRRFFPTWRPTRASAEVQAEEGPLSVLELGTFLLLAPYLAAKSMFDNWIVTRKLGPERGFEVRLSPHYFYLDTVKYRGLREKYRDIDAGRTSIPSSASRGLNVGSLAP